MSLVVWCVQGGELDYYLSLGARDCMLWVFCGINPELCTIQSHLCEIGSYTNPIQYNTVYTQYIYIPTVQLHFIRFFLFI